MIQSEESLVEVMTRPTAQVESAVRTIDGDIVILGVAGKMGPTLAELLIRAGARRVIGVSRFSEPAVELYLQGIGVETIKADLLDDDALASLPDAACVYLMAGVKFGATGCQSGFRPQHDRTGGYLRTEYRACPGRQTGSGSGVRGK
jgi:hypothetical protein